MKTETPSPIRLKDYRPSDYLIDHVDLDFFLAPTATKVRARLKMRSNPAVLAQTQALRLDGERLELNELKLDGTVLGSEAYTVTATSLIVHNVPAKNFIVETITTVNPQANTALIGLYLSNGIYCTQCEAQGFRRITYFLDRPDILATYTTRIEADLHEAATLLANGNPVERGSCRGGNRHYAVWKDPHIKPSYLFALVGGNLKCFGSTFKTASGKSVDLRIYVEAGKEERCGWAMDALKRAMKWEEEHFGREYDLDVFNIVAVPDFNMGAMENKGLNIFNDRLILASPKTATDRNYQQIESVVAHEYFHNWTGNRITCRDWFQLCLKEGLTVYRDQEFTADTRERTVERIESVRLLRTHQFPEDAGPLAHPVRPSSYIEINNFYTATVYEKGAELVRMIETIVGRDGFRAGMDLYFARHDGDAATIEDFLQCFEDAAGADLKQFHAWYNQAGTPELVCKLVYDAEEKTAELEVQQIIAPTPGEAKKKMLHIPLKLGLLDRNGNDFALVLADGTVLADNVLHIAKRNQKFKFKNITTKPVPSYLRGFSAPVKLVAEQSDRDLAFLMEKDTDLFSRWQAASDYAIRLLIKLAKAAEPKQHTARIRTFAQALEKTIANAGLDSAYRGELLKLPSEADIAREIACNVDPDAIVKTRNIFAKIIGKTIGGTLEQIYAQTSAAGDFSPDAASAGRRALRNASLTLLVYRGTASDKARLLQHYENATNMTDESHALMLLAQCGGKARGPALEAFYERWKSDHIVIDTWFATQATVPTRATLGQVKRLMRCEQFSITNPNKVRALIGNFATQNPSQFNRPDGKGYAFVSAQVLALDKINPQIAARLLNAYRCWRSMEPGRRQHAETTLGGLAQTPGLSRDVYEIATKMLDG